MLHNQLCERSSWFLRNSLPTYFLTGPWPQKKHSHIAVSHDSSAFSCCISIKTKWHTCNPAKGVEKKHHDVIWQGFVFSFNLLSHKRLNSQHCTWRPSDTCRHCFTSSNTTGIGSEGKSFLSHPSEYLFSLHSYVSSSQGEASTSRFLTCTCCIFKCEFTGLCLQSVQEI